MKMFVYLTNYLAICIVRRFGLSFHHSYFHLHLSSTLILYSLVFWLLDHTSLSITMHSALPEIKNVVIQLHMNHSLHNVIPSKVFCNKITNVTPGKSPGPDMDGP